MSFVAATAYIAAFSLTAAAVATGAFYLMAYRPYVRKRDAGKPKP